MPCRLEAKFFKEHLQVTPLVGADEGRPATFAGQTTLGFPRRLVEGYAQLGGPLDDVKELAERQAQEHQDDGEFMQIGQGSKVAALQGLFGYGEQDPRDRHRNQNQERQDIQIEALGCRVSFILAPADEGQHAARDDHHRRKVKDVEGQEAREAVHRKAPRAESEQPGLVTVLIEAFRGEPDPAEDQRKGHGKGQQTAPRDQGVSAPSLDGALPNKTLEENLVQGQQGHLRQ